MWISNREIRASCEIIWGIPGILFDDGIIHPHPALTQMSMTASKFYVSGFIRKGLLIGSGKLIGVELYLLSATS